MSVDDRARVRDGPGDSVDDRDAPESPEGVALSNNGGLMSTLFSVMAALAIRSRAHAVLCTWGAGRPLRLSKPDRFDETGVSAVLMLLCPTLG